MSNDTPQSSSRWHFVGLAAAALAAGSLSRLAFADTSTVIGKITEPANGDKSALRPFRVHIPDSRLVEMRHRIKATRWPDRETVPDESQLTCLISRSGSRLISCGEQRRAGENAHVIESCIVRGCGAHFRHTSGGLRCGASK